MKNKVEKYQQFEDFKKNTKRLSKEYKYDFIVSVLPLIEIYEKTSTINKNIADMQFFLSTWILIETSISKLYIEQFDKKKRVSFACEYTAKGKGGLLDLPFKDLSANQQKDLTKLEKYCNDIDMDKISISRKICILSKNSFLPTLFFH